MGMAISPAAAVRPGSVSKKLAVAPDPIQTPEQISNLVACRAE